MYHCMVSRNRRESATLGKIYVGNVYVIYGVVLVFML